MYGMAFLKVSKISEDVLLIFVGKLMQPTLSKNITILNVKIGPSYNIFQANFQVEPIDFED